MYSFAEKALLEAMDASGIVAQNQSVAIKLGYSNVLGTATREVGLVETSANGDVLFFVGSSLTSYSLDTLMSAAASGRLDVSNASFNTVGECVDYVNSRTAATGWTAFPVDSLRSDSTNNTLRALTRTNDGLQVRGKDLVFDTLTSAVFSTIGLTFAVTGPREFKNNPYYGRRSYADQKAVLRGVQALVDYSTGALEMRLYERDKDNTETLRATLVGPAGNTAQSWDFSNGGDFRNGVSFAKGSELIVRLRATSTFGVMSSGTLQVNAHVASFAQ